MILLLITLLSAGALFAVGKQEPEAAAPEAKVLKAALLTSGFINEGGWNTFAYEGLVELQDKFGFEIANTELVQQSAQKSILRNYAKKVYDLIIGHGFEYGESLVEVAAEFPDIAFYQVGGIALADNVGSAVFKSGPLSYLAGKLAALFTNTNKIGFVGAMEIPTIVREVEVITEVSKEINPDSSVAVTYTGSWTDVNKGKEAALAQINQRVDVIIVIGDACDFGAIKAAEEAGAYVIGWVGDFNVLSPDVFITSGIQSVHGLIVDQGEAVSKGTFKAKHRDVGIKEVYMYMGTWSDVVPQEIKDEIMADQKAIIDGTLDLDKWM